MDALLRQKLESAQEECAMHLKRMSYAHGNIRAFLPTDATRLSQLNDEQIEALEQYLYRFTKLQDAMGQRLFKHSLAWLAEDVRSMAFIDQLNQLEKLGAIESAQTWLELRKLRNLLAHEYASDDAEKASAINLVFGHYQTMAAMLERFNQYLAARQ